MRLSACIPTLPAELIAHLEACGIRTDEDLLFSAPVDEIYARLPAGTVDLRSLQEYIARVAELASAPMLSATDVLTAEEAAEQNAPAFPSGIAELDQLVDNFRGRHVFEIAGDTKSGRSTLVLNIVLRHLVESPLASVIWVDTIGEFSADRAMRILECYDTQDAISALDRLQVLPAFEVGTLYDLLDKLDAPHDIAFPVHCIVVDTIAALLCPLLSTVSAHGHAVLTELMHHLRVFARERLVSIFVINDTISSASNDPRGAFPTGRVTVLGPTFSFLTDATLLLSKHSDSKLGSLYIVEILRSKITKSGSWSKFRLDRYGLLSASTED